MIPTIHPRLHRQPGAPRPATDSDGPPARILAATPARATAFVLAVDGPTTEAEPWS
jgi:hypothetical protein